MASIVDFSRGARGCRVATPVPAGGGVVVAMHHIDLEAVTETIRALRTLGKLSLLDEFNGRRHLALQQDAAPRPA